MEGYYKKYLRLAAVAIVVCLHFSQASLAQGTVDESGWCTVLGVNNRVCTSSPQAACKLQRDRFAEGAPLRPYIDTDNWWRKECDWIWSLGDSRPASVSFQCDNTGVSRSDPAYLRRRAPGACVTTAQEQRLALWSDFSALEDAYQAVIGTNEAAYANQYRCIASRSCEEFVKNPDGWANNFVKHVFDENLSEGLPPSIRTGCPEGVSSAGCLGYGKGSIHGTFELAPSFGSYCSQINATSDFALWIDDHNQFLDNAVGVCFDELATSEEISQAEANEWKATTAILARGLRFYAMASCALAKDIPLPVELNSGALLLSELVTNDTSSLSPLLTIEQNNPHLVVIGSQDYVLQVGSSYPITVQSKADGSTIPLASLAFQLDEFTAQFVSVSSQGLLTVNQKPIPGPSPNIPLAMGVLVGDELSLGQFAIADMDTDDDRIVDSYEVAVGFDPLVPLDPTTDSDNDGVTDLLEALMRTIPLQSQAFTVPLMGGLGIFYLMVSFVLIVLRALRRNSV